jgi:hypothetical protein
MFGEVSKQNSNLRGIFVHFIRIFVFFSLSAPFLFADAYLAEDRIYYGADTYKINYKDEIITALGNAYYRKGSASVYARRIVIHYAENEKKAFFFDDVRLLEKDRGYELEGDYGEALFRDDHYVVTGNVVFMDEKMRVSAERAESVRFEDFRFFDEVTYSDESVTIQSRTLDLREDDSALFQGDVYAHFTESGDELYCRVLTHFIDKGNSEFREDVIYIQKETDAGDERPFVIKAEMAQYFRDTDLFLLMDGVYATDGRYSLRGPMVKYFREFQILESIGSTVVHDGKRTIYCDRMQLDVDEEEMAFFGSIRGVIDVD